MTDDTSDGERITLYAHGSKSARGTVSEAGLEPTEPVLATLRHYPGEVAITYRFEQDGNETWIEPLSIEYEGVTYTPEE